MAVLTEAQLRRRVFRALVHSGLAPRVAHLRARELVRFLTRRRGA